MVLQELKELTSRLKRDPKYSTSQGEREINRPKNRYKDILPCKSCMYVFLFAKQTCRRFEVRYFLYFISNLLLHNRTEVMAPDRIQKKYQITQKFESIRARS